MKSVLATDEENISIRRVGNGWVVYGRAPQLVAESPSALTDIISCWAYGQHAEHMRAAHD
jgi:hypothetical protein